MTTLTALTNPAQANAPTVVNANFDATSAAAIFGKKAAMTTGLTWGYYGGLYNGNTIADGTVTLNNAADNYVVVLRSTGVVSTSTSSANSVNPLYAQLYKVTTAASAVTTIVDQRWDANGLWFSGGSTTSANIPAQRYTIELLNTTDSDPGAGLIKFNNATPASATMLYIDDSTSDGVDLSTYFAGLGGTGYITIQSTADAGEWAIFKWTAITDGTGYFKFAVTPYASLGTLDDADAVAIAFDSDASGVGSVAGSDKQIQYNDGGVVGAEAGFEYDKTNNRLAVPVTKLGDGTTYNANPATGDTDPHWVEIVNNPSAGAGKQFFRMVGYAGNTGYGNNMHFERAGGTEAAPSAVPDVCYLLSMGFRGWNGTAMSASKAAFQVLTTEAWSGTANGCKFHWEVTPNGSTTRATAMDLDSTGATVVGKVQATRLIGAAVALTDAATIAIDASLGNNFRVTLGGNRTLGNPTNLVDGQQGLIRVKQDATGSRTLAYASMWKFPGGAPTLTTTASATDVISWQYDATDATIMAVISKAFA